MNANQIVQAPKQDAGALLEKVITCNDLAGLTPVEKVAHIRNICESLNLNPLTMPIQLIKFQGKEIAYFTRGATEQLRRNNNVSITKLESQVVNEVYVATAYAQCPDGRSDSSTGAVSIAGLKGEALCNAIMKAETKAKRRVTLSICGLGMLDESETEGMRAPVNQERPRASIAQIESEGKALDLAADIEEIRKSDSLDVLELNFKRISGAYRASKNGAGLTEIIKAKNERKEAIQKLADEYLNKDIAM